MRIKRDKADAVFSTYIRTRDNWQCQRCHTYYPESTTGGRQALHCSHYFTRGRESTRFDPRNCIALCYGCHRLWESQEREQYRAFMVKALGENGFKILEMESNRTTKKDREMSYIKSKALLDELTNNNK